MGNTAVEAVLREEIDHVGGQGVMAPVTREANAGGGGQPAQGPGGGAPVPGAGAEQGVQGSVPGQVPGV